MRAFDPTPASGGCLRFSDVEIDIDARTIFRAGVPVHLQPQPFEVLLTLLATPGRLVSREAMRQRIWSGNTFVDFDHSLNIAVNKLRAVLDDSAETPRFIETIPRRGYRFIGTIELTVPEGRQPAAATFVVTRGRRQFPLEAGENVLGRDVSAQVRLDHALVSRRHARILVAGDRATLEDLQSRNGTFLDGRRLEAPADIQHGAIIGLGPLTLRFARSSAANTTLPVGDHA